MNPNTSTKFSRNNFRAMLRQNVVAYQVNDHVWSVPSSSIPAKAYLVTAHYQRGVLVTTCTCEAGKAKIGCKHALAVIHDIQRDNRKIAALMPMEQKRAA